MSRPKVFYGYGSAFAVACGFLLLGATLSLTIDERFRRRAPELTAASGWE